MQITKGSSVRIFSRLQGLSALLLIGVIIWGCKNEPYIIGDLGVTSISNKKRSTVDGYHYKGSNLFLYEKKSTTATLTSRKFYYADGQLEHVISDSTAWSASGGVWGYKLTKVFTMGGVITEDSTRSIDSLETEIRTELISHRTYHYADAEHIDLITCQQWAAGVLSTKEYKYYWNEDDDLVSTESYVVNGEVRDRIDSTGVEFDLSKSVFHNSTLIFLYTLPLNEYYRLSPHNAKTIQHKGSTGTTISYNYNRFNYPSDYTKDPDSLFTVAYTEWPD